MKTLKCALLMALGFLVFTTFAQAQYRGARNYFPKNYPAPNNNNAGGQNGGGQGNAAGARTTPGAPNNANPAQPLPPKFKDLELNAQFYFVTDTNREYAWMKLTKTTAKNTKNGVTTAIAGDTP